mmetsp:Transcript_24199/g.42746  ORF Transcript_24199/g.42746 Transcript_24199/m.42746 type:complete len:80 (+) Transcript_24199:1508-1747(+)
MSLLGSVGALMTLERTQMAIKCMPDTLRIPASCSAPLIVLALATLKTHVAGVTCMHRIRQDLRRAGFLFGVKVAKTSAR